MGGTVAPPSVDPFLEAKVHRPPVREDWVDRERLLAQMDDASECPVVLISAAAGYGKTTLMTQWLATGPAERRAAWVSLDPGDNDPGRLWTHIGTALERVGCVVEGGAADRLVSTNINSLRERVLPSIVNALAAVPDDVFIVLDDFHFVSDAECHGQVEYLIENLPPRAHIVIITRADPGLRLARLRASGRLAEIRAHDLGFNDIEASEMMALERVPLSSDSVTRLLERTEGWPAGIYLASLWLAGKASPDDAVRQFTGGIRFIGDYLTEEVLSQHSRETREFIVTMSFLDWFSAPLCDYVRQTTGSAAILHELERSNLFLIPLDEERHWFRFHNLFAAVASGELEAEHAEQLPALHLRAAQWFRDQDHIDEAVRHFLAAADRAEASALVQSHWMTYVDAGRAVTVQGWLDALGTTSTAMDPASAVAAAWVAALFGDTANLTRLLAELEEFRDYGPLPDGISSVGSAIAMIQGLFGYGGPVEMLAGAQRAVELETDGHSPYYALATLTLGHAVYVAGDLDAAANLLGKAAYNDAAPDVIKVQSLATLSLVEGERGRQPQSGQLARTAMHIVDDKRLRSMPQVSMAFTALGQAQAVEGRLEDAMKSLDEGLILIRRQTEQGPWAALHHLLVTARVAVASGRLAQAQELSDDAAERVARLPDGIGSMASRLAGIQTALRSRLTESGLAEPLTDRELDVLRLLQGSLSLRDIGRALSLSANTVKTHTNAVYRKLGAHSRAEAVWRAREWALI